jgi:hypothetical protein
MKDVLERSVEGVRLSLDSPKKKMTAKLPFLFLEIKEHRLHPVTVLWTYAPKENKNHP